MKFVTWTGQFIKTHSSILFGLFQEISVTVPTLTSSVPQAPVLAQDVLLCPVTMTMHMPYLTTTNFTCAAPPKESN